MKIKLLLVGALIAIQCTSSNRKSDDVADAVTDTVTTASESSSENPVLDQSMNEPTETSIDVDMFTKHPFESDYPLMKRLLKENGVALTVIVEDTINSENRTLLFDSSRIEFLDSDPAYQEELGDLICSADISSATFYFNQGVTIGMTQEDFLRRAGLDKSAIIQDQESGKSYYEHEIPFDDGHWKMTLYFEEHVLIRFLYEISPCYFEYDH